MSATCFSPVRPWAREPGHAVDFAYIDGHHQEAPTIEYWQTIRPYLTAAAVVVFDDVQWSAGMTRAWRQVRAEASARAVATVFGMGVLWL